MLSPLIPVSMKGVLFINGQVVLLMNERREWELPGGRRERGEEPVACLVREFEEELGIRVTVETLLDCWLYRIRDNAQVLVVTYGCRAPDGLSETALILSHEHKDLGCFSIAQVDSLPMPEGYRRSIQDWANRTGISGA